MKINPKDRDSTLPQAAPSDHPSCLCLFDREAGEAVEHIPLTAEEFSSALQRSIAEGRPSLASFVAEAIREKLASNVVAALSLN